MSVEDGYEMYLIDQHVRVYFDKESKMAYNVSFSYLQGKVEYDLVEKEYTCYDNYYYSLDVTTASINDNMNTGTTEDNTVYEDMCNYYTDEFQDEYTDVTKFKEFFGIPDISPSSSLKGFE